jgi:hypothetical protein
LPVGRSRRVKIGIAVAVVGAGMMTVTPGRTALAAGPFTIHPGDPPTTWTGGPVVGAVANVGPPPAPVCQPGNCDRTSFTLAAPAGFTVNNRISVTVKIVFPAGPTGGQEDVGILNAANQLMAGTVASNSPATVTASDLPTGNYVVEVDGDTGDPTATSYMGTLTAVGSPRTVVNPPQSSTTNAFSTPTVVDPIHPYGEPDIRVDHHGRVFVSGPTGTGTQRSLWSTSLDGGATWRAVAQGPPPNSVLSDPLTQPGGGDTDIAFDQSDKQYFADLYALACQRVQTTTTAGASVMENPAGCAPGLSGSDRQWLLVYDPPQGTPKLSAYAGTLPLVYNEYNDVATAPAMGSTGPSFWTKSVPDSVPGDPGLSYTSARGTPQKTVFGADGYPSIDQVTGKVLQATFFDSTTIKLNIGTPDAAGNLTFLDDKSGGTANLVTVANNVDNNGDVANFVVSSLDDARNLWVAWVGRDNGDPSQRQVYAAVARADTNWSMFSQPVRLSAAPSLVNIFPWVKAAGKSGIADVVWYGSYIPGQPGFYPDPSTDLGQVWDVYMGQVRFPVDQDGAVIVGGGPAIPPSQVRVSPHHMDYNSACLQGTGCITSKGNRNLADFFEVNVDQHGAAVIVYDDMSNGLIQTTSGFTLNPNGQQVVDHNGAAVVTVARQSAGLGLLGTDVPNTYPPNTPLGNGVNFADPQGAGGAQFPVIPGGPLPSNNVPGMDVLGTSMSLASGVLTITSKVLDLSSPAATAAAVGASHLQYVTRWQMATPGDSVHPYTMYYAMAEYNSPTPGCPLGSPVTACFSAGAAQSIDLCSVSACDPHVLVYPESGGGPALTGINEPGNVFCPLAPSAAMPCTITMQVNAADIGNPSNSSLLEEVGTYAFAAARNQAPTTNAQAQADDVPLEVDGLCCFNFQATPTVQTPEVPWAPALVLVGAALMASGVSLRRRRRDRRPGAVQRSALE